MDEGVPQTQEIVKQRALVIPSLEASETPRQAGFLQEEYLGKGEEGSAFRGKLIIDGQSINAVFKELRYRSSAASQSRRYRDLAARNEAAEIGMRLPSFYYEAQTQDNAATGVLMEDFTDGGTAVVLSSNDAEVSDDPQENQLHQQARVAALSMKHPQLMTAFATMDLDQATASHLEVVQRAQQNGVEFTLPDAWFFKLAADVSTEVIDAEPTTIDLDMQGASNPQYNQLIFTQFRDRILRPLQNEARRQMQLAAQTEGAA